MKFDNQFKIVDIKDVESLLLRVFRPKGNRVVGRFKRGYNLAKKIKRS